jgi:UDPglucose 6-dehydrogenase
MLPTPSHIAVITANATGLSAAIALSQQHCVVIQDNDAAKVSAINVGISPVDDPGMRHYLAFKKLKLRATRDLQDALQHASLVIIATTTGFREDSKSVDTTPLDKTIRSVQRLNPQALTVLEATLPVGYTRARSRELNANNLLAAPALVRPGHALEDRLYAARFIIGEQSGRGRHYASLLQQAACLPRIPVLLTGSAEAEAIQLLSLRQLLTRENTPEYRIRMYAQQHQLKTHHLFEGLSSTPWPQDATS